MDDIWYRAEIVYYADWDPWAEFEQLNTSTPKLEFLEYKVLSTTPKGVWLENYNWHGYSKRFVLGTSLKQFAVPTKELAIRDCYARISRNISIYTARLKGLERSLITCTKAFEALNPILNKYFKKSIFSTSIISL